MKTADPIAKRPHPELRSLFDSARESGLAADLKQRIEGGLKRRSRRRRGIAASAALVAVAVFAAWAIPFVRSTDRVATAPGQRQVLLLDDGTQAELNAQTRLRTDFRGRERVAVLERGEAFFRVAKDASKPFVLKTPAGEIRVLGTQFNVRVNQGAAAVTLAEGRVDFMPAVAGPAVAMSPGDHLVAKDGAWQRRVLAADEVADLLAWRRGELVLDGMTAGEAIARLAEYHGCRISVAPEVAQLNLGGVYQLDDLDAFLNGLREFRGVRVVANADGSYSVLRR